MLHTLHKITLRVSEITDTIAKIVLVPAFFVVVTTFIAQIVCRFVFDYSLMWYLDLIRMCYAWALFLGFAVAYKAKEHILLEALFDRLSDPVKRWCVFIGHLLSLAFFILMILKGTEYTISSARRALTTIPIHRGWKVVGVPISGLMLTIHIAPLIIDDLIGFKEKTRKGLTYFGKRSWTE